MVILCWEALLLVPFLWALLFSWPAGLRIGLGALVVVGGIRLLMTGARRWEHELELRSPTRSRRIPWAEVSEIRAAPDRVLWYRVLMLVVVLRDGELIRFPWISWTTHWNYLGEDSPLEPPRVTRALDRLRAGPEHTERTEW